ncbi:phytoene/squalene synthase family protein [Streptomyces zagrosensis]|uniref:Phytoene synthase n=1 Tax=Streptomyces zagrosensis TaxID=1042984 RepID=A0A7W9QHI7_9ACTN|nr:phytoene/squalene synthase family protein [Streptomyces zagrosensis]MBB5939763.1 phytoene synthase [Streptomyces zagrosensis]
MTARELDAAGIHDAALRAAYTRCRQINAHGGATYFLATRLLTPHQRPAVHALYGFARHADDIVDALDDATDVTARAAALDALAATVDRALRTGRSDHPVVAALADTAGRYRIEPAHFTDFMHSMRMDLHVTDYPNWQALRTYMHGSAAVIGLQLLPVLGTVVPREEAAPHAASLGVAFQLTNFLRDVGEDLDRGRVYLPRDLLAAHDVDRALLMWCRATGHTDHRVRDALRELIHLTRGSYRHAAKGVPMLHPASRPCVRTAFILYHAILQRIEAADYAVIDHRAIVPRRHRAAIALGGLATIGAGRLRGALGPGGGPPTRAGAPA